MIQQEEKRKARYTGNGVRRGFTLLLAVLLGSLLFSMGIAIANLTLKELTLSSAARESEKAFYAADSGIECALFWDRRESDVFPTKEGVATPRSDITCRTLVPLTFDEMTKTAATTTFFLSFPLSPQCAYVTVGKVARQGKNPELTVIESRGRNECGAGDNPARVERALRVRY
jgi:hypothetical protein